MRHKEPDRVPVALAYGTPRSLCASYARAEEAGRFRQDLMAVRFCNPDPPEAEIRRGYAKRKYRGCLALLGTICAQTTLSWGTPQEVKAAVARRMAECASAGIRRRPAP